VYRELHTYQLRERIRKEVDAAGIIPCSDLRQTSNNIILCVPKTQIRAYW